MVSKVQERIYVEAAVKLLKVDWKINEIPEPLDFEVQSPEGIFGMEVRQIFVDDEEIFGSPAKRGESNNIKVIKKLAKSYYAAGGVPIFAKFLGSFATVDMNSLVNFIVASAPVYPGGNVTIETQGVKVFMTSLLPAWTDYSRWVFVNDRVGWVRPISTNDLQQAVNRKQEHLPSYKKKYENIDLLLVADRLFNSGKLFNTGLLRVSNPGFRTIYFLSYPYDIKNVG